MKNILSKRKTVVIPRNNKTKLEINQSKAEIFVVPAAALAVLIPKKKNDDRIVVKNTIYPTEKPLNLDGFFFITFSPIF